MKNKAKLILGTLLCAFLLTIPVHAEEITIDVTSAWSENNYINELLNHSEEDIVHFVNENGEEVVLSEEIFEKVKSLRQETIETSSELTTESIIEETTSETETQAVNNTEPEKNPNYILTEESNNDYWVGFKANIQEGTTVNMATDVIFVLRNIENGDTFSVNLNSSNNFATQTMLPEGTYEVEVATESLNGEKINDFVETDISSFTITGNEENLILEATLYGSQTIEIEEKTENETESNTIVEKVPEEKENFWLNLLKNNIFFIIILLACGGTLFYIRYKQDNM